MKSGLELEIRQSQMYFVLLFVICYFTSYLFLCIYLSSWIVATLEELDPEDVESEEELWPFLEFTYIETNWRKGWFFIKVELEKERNEIEKVLPIENLTPWFEKDDIRWYKRRKFDKKVNNTRIDDVIVLNDIGILKSTFI